MDVPCTSLEDNLQLDLALTRLDLTEARASQEAEDTPAARRRVAEARALADSLLDMWNDLALASA